MIIVNFLVRCCLLSYSYEALINEGRDEIFFSSLRLITLTDKIVIVRNLNKKKDGI